MITSDDMDHARRVAKRIRAGYVHITSGHRLSYRRSVTTCNGESSAKPIYLTMPIRASPTNGRPGGRLLDRQLSQK